MPLKEAVRELETLLDDERHRGQFDWAARTCELCRDVMHHVVLAPLSRTEIEGAIELFERALSHMDPDDPQIGLRHKNVALRIRNLRHLLRGEPPEITEPEPRDSVHV